MPNYRNGKVYILTGSESGNKVYIGSTIQDLPQRKSEHNYSRKNADRPQFQSSELKGKLKIQLLEKFPTSSKTALEKHEAKVIEYMRSKKGVKVVNGR